MNLKIPLRLGRILVVLALIVALLGSSIPVPARAAGFTPALYALDATNIIVAGARALGIAPGSDPSVFNEMVSDAETSLFSGVSPLVNIWLDSTSNGYRAFAPAEFLARLLSFMFIRSYLTKSSVSASSSCDVTINGTLYEAWAGVDLVYCCFTYRYFSNGAEYPMFACFGLSDSSSFSLFHRSSGSTNSIPSKSLNGVNYVRFVYGGYYAHTTVSGIPVIDAGVLSSQDAIIDFATSFDYSSIISSDSDLTLDAVSDSLSGSVYSSWTSESITEYDQPFVPLSLPSISDSAAIFTQTQAQAQAGTVPDSVVDDIIAGAEVVPETGTISDVITAVRALGADIVAAVQSIPAAIADIFSLAADPEAYQVDLKDFFPFCIPFDLFDIVTAFAAEPEAPVFEWPISVPRWGFEYTLKVDLQEWEDIASLFRTLELTIFCVGLAIVTREKFLRS